MGKGFFTQGIAVLFERAPSLDTITSAIATPIVRRIDERSGWMSGPSLLVAHRPEVNGYITIDVIDEPWPDGMGSPAEAPDLFGAWSMGFFGPFTFPGNLRRACEQAWHLQPRPDPLVARHRAFVRVRVSYTLGADPEAKVMPPDVDPVGELEAVHRLARRVLDLPGSLLLFDPNAEMLLTAELFDRLEDDARAGRRLPLDAWMNVRLFRLEGLADGWTMMDTVGLAQLDRTDLEACFPRGHDPDAVAGFLKSIALYVAGKGDVIADGHTVDGPGGRWRARHHEQGLTDPPRRVVRLAPDGVRLPDELTR